MTKSAPREQATTNGNNVEIELTAEELDRVVGGGKSRSHSSPTGYLKVTMSDIIITSF